MEEKEQTELSVGAKKIEKLENQAKTAKNPPKRAKKTVKTANAEPSKREIRLAKKEEAEKKRAERRLQIAKLRLENKEKRLARKDERKNLRFEKKQERIARRELLKNETATQRFKRIEREKRERAELRRQKHEKRHEIREKRQEERKKRRLERLEQRRERRSNRNGNHVGGWIAAVVSLGAVVLTMSALVAVGIVGMGRLNRAVDSIAYETVYEASAISQELDNRLSKVRISQSAAMQQRILTDVLIDSELMASSFERMPLDYHGCENAEDFANQLADYARSLLKRTADGTPLTDGEKAEIERMYEANARLKDILTELCMSVNEGEMKLLRKGEAGMIDSAMRSFRNEKSGQDAEDGQTAALLANEPSVSADEAKSICRQMFSDYSVGNIEYKGETNARQLACFNFAMTDENGRDYYAQITKNGGKLVFFDCYEECHAQNYTTEDCISAAKEFLADTVGMENITPVWVSESGATVNLRFASVQDGVVLYSDSVDVKVCKTKGTVVGLDCSNYLKNSKSRSLPAPAITKGEALDRVGGLKAENCSLCLIESDGTEVLCYEVRGSYGESEFYLYIDAVTGDEVELYEVVQQKQGNRLL